MSDTTNSNGKKRPDYIAHAVRQQSGSGPKYTRIGVGFNVKNGGISVLYDAIPLSGQIVLLDADGEKPATLSYGSPARKPDFAASMVRDGKDNNAFWTEVGVAYRQEGYVSILLNVVPTGGKIILTQPREQA
jgi:hypothetical protein